MHAYMRKKVYRSHRSLLIWQWQSIFAIILIKISIIFSTSTSAFNLTILYIIYIRNKHLIYINTPTVCSINRLPFKVFSGRRRTTTWKCLRYYSENCTTSACCAVEKQGNEEREKKRKIELNRCLHSNRDFIVRDLCLIQNKIELFFYYFPYQRYF